MPVIGPALSALIQTNVDSKMSPLGGQPLAQVNPTYFIALCTAIGTGIALGSPLITFTTTDSGSAGAPPIPGVGSGVGIIVDDAFFAEDLYTRLRNNIISQFGSSTHDPYPPGSGNSGEFLKALAEGIAVSVKTHFTTAWTLVSAHPTIYLGSATVDEGNFSGLVPATIKSAIIAAGPLLIGDFFPKLAEAVAESYVATIHNHSTANITITGVCVPGPTQVCALPSSGSGTGTAT